VKEEDTMINLSKDKPSVSLKKGAVIRARVTWPSVTDYDLGAEVIYADGHTESVAAFGAGKKLTGAYLTPKQMTTRDGKVHHLGDVKRGNGSMAEEILEIELTDEIIAVVPWAYSAQGNGTGSFFHYSVSMEATDGNETVKVDAVNASNDDRVYTCIPGMITNYPGEGPRVEYLERYSERNSENRPRVTWTKPSLMRKGGLEINVNGGHKNEYKRD
jgi:tellurite resistance protein TerA